MTRQTSDAGRLEISRLVAQLEANGPLAFRGLPAKERRWRGRYALMAMVIGASPVYAWANAMAGGSAGEAARALAETVDDDALAAAVEREGVRVGDLFV